MPHLVRTLAVLVAAALATGSCAAGPDVDATRAPGRPTPSGPATPAPTEIAFAPAAWPAAGSACDDPAYRGRLGRIEAVDALTVRFTLCAPDGAFRTRLANPSLAIVDSMTIARLTADPGAAQTILRTVPGTGPYRIAAWTPTSVRLGLVSAAPTETSMETVVIGWMPDGAARMSALLTASVDGIDGPGAAAAEALAIQPEVAVIKRPGLATAYLGFGTGPAFASVRVRRAISMGLDRGTLADVAGPGSLPATHTAPCVVAGGCEGAEWYSFNAPSGASLLAAAAFKLSAVYPLSIPDAPVPGLPDPVGLAEAVRSQLKANLGIDVELDVVPAAALAADIAAGTVGGMYLAGVASPLADASGFLEPLFGHGLGSTAAGRATGVADALDELARTTGIAARSAILRTANDAIRSTVPIAPLVHPGTVAVFRSDVADAAISPMGLDRIGSLAPGDRHQVVFVGAVEPAGAWCADQVSLDAYRLCGLVTEGLYGFKPGGVAVEPRLAVRCAPNADATVWTCRLRPETLFHDGMRLDAGDVLASLVAQWDPAGPLRATAPEGAFSTWDALFGPSAGG